MDINVHRSLQRLNLTKISKFRRLLSKKRDLIDGQPIIFLSYAHEDRHWLEKLVHVLQPYLPSTAIFWDDSNIRRGRWREKIKSALDASLVFSFLVTPNMLRSKFIMDTELPIAVEKASNSAADISWILLEDCDVLESALSDWQGFIDLSKRIGADAALCSVEEPKQSRILDEYAMSILDAAQERLAAL